MDKPIESSLIYRTKNTADETASGVATHEQKEVMRATSKKILQLIVDKHSA